MNIGIICPSEIAFRRFMPALLKNKFFNFVGLGVASLEEAGGALIPGQKDKANEFVNQYGGKIFNSYTDIVTSKEIEAVYLPLPPALHYKWAKLALENNKQVLVEKPSTIWLKDTEDLVKNAKERELVLHENYMFIFHKQLQDINDIVNSGRIGDVRLYRISFGFPLRALNDFRYNKVLGGGALIDAGGYTFRYATMLLGSSTKMVCAQSNFLNNFEVDMYGSATLVNDKGVTAQVSFGMDNDYKCELEIWGSKGTLLTNRVLTAPVGYVPEAIIKNGVETEFIKLSEDDAFYNSICYFKECLVNKEKREENYLRILKQAELVETFRKMAGVL